ncbi:cytochrome P450 [Pseudonocardia acaciae]|uniref:cytochrome P450 n=1 Tax=Pseudonocardia acaciae TaxID=551276 RepID=UPI00048C717D|nr:cytochrome P450 [Pseudonocardia acaciae]
MTGTSIAEAIGPRRLWPNGRRPERPVEFDEEHGVWHVHGYPEAVEILGNPRTFSSNINRLFDPNADAPGEGDLLRMDPPDHRKLRNLVSRAFSRKVVADLEPRIAEITHELLGEVAGRDRLELVADLAHPLPVIVIAELLGVPSSDRQLFRTWADELLNSDNEFGPGDDEQTRMQAIADSQAVTDRINAYLLEHALERRRRPRADLLTQLVQAEVDGERLTDTEVATFAGLLLLAGHITTTLLLGSSVLCLDAHPDRAAQVRADRSLVPGLIEESVRFASPFTQVIRATQVEAEIGGRRVPPDQMLVVWLSSANRDPRQFADPDVFDPTRDPNPHLGFGRGVHFCIGAPLARLEGRVVLNILLDTYRELRTDPAAPPVFMSSTITNGVEALPLLVST